MDLLHRCCAGLDVHKETVVACVRSAGGSEPNHDVKTFGTTTKDLLSLSDWMTSAGVTHVVMESTGVYWRPVWNILDGAFDLTLANAQHVRNVPGRKSDVNDAVWLSDLLAHGLVRKSAVPDLATYEHRELTRTRKQIVREQVRHALRIQKTLESANIKLSSVVTDVLGKSGRAILRAIVNGESDPERLASLARPNVKASREELTEALRGRITRSRRFMLGVHLDQVEHLECVIKSIDMRIEDFTRSFRDAVSRLSGIPGVSDVSGNAILAEIGLDMSHFPTAGHLLSWAGLVPRLDESAGKRRDTRIRKGSTWLKTTLVQCAWAAIRKKDTYYRAQFHRLKAKRGPKKAIVAVAASMLTAIYHMLKSGTEYRELGGNHFDQRDKTKSIESLCKRLRKLGVEIEIKQAAS